ncbi:hypothetical protein COOONC_05864 [Cooperia oncophora]
MSGGKRVPRRRVVATEIYRARTTEGPLPRYKLGSTIIHATIVQVIIYIGYSQVGFMCVFVLTNLTKRCVGRLRPHFLDVCKPLNITCNGHEYVVSRIHKERE